MWGQDDDLDEDDGKDEDDDEGGGARIGEGKGREGRPHCPRGTAVADVTPDRVGGHGAQSGVGGGNDNKRHAGSILRASPCLAKWQGGAAKENDGGDGSDDEDDNEGDDGKLLSLLSSQRC